MWELAPLIKNIWSDPDDGTHRVRRGYDALEQAGNGPERPDKQEGQRGTTRVVRREALGELEG